MEIYSVLEFFKLCTGEFFVARTPIGHVYEEVQELIKDVHLAQNCFLFCLLAREGWLHPFGALMSRTDYSRANGVKGCQFGFYIAFHLANNLPHLLNVRRIRFCEEACEETHGYFSLSITQNFRPWK